MWSALVPLLFAVGAQQPAQPAPVRPRLLVLEFKSDVSERALAKALAAEAVAALDDRDHVEVVSLAEVKSALELEANKQESGCDAASCASEIAGALGAELVVFGDVVRLDSLYVISVQLYDAKASTLLGREVIRADGDAIALHETRAAVKRLVPRQSLPLVTILGGATLGAGALTLATGGALWAVSNATLDNPATSGDDKERALTLRPAAVAIAGVGAAAFVLGAVTVAAGLLLE